MAIKTLFYEKPVNSKNIRNIESPIIICNVEQRFIVAEQNRETNIIPKSILLDPIGKNKQKQLLQKL